jgi:hypothetical protein
MTDWTIGVPLSVFMSAPIPDDGAAQRRVS